MILYLDGKRIDTLYEAYLWLRERRGVTNRIICGMRNLARKVPSIIGSAFLSNRSEAMTTRMGGIFVASKSLKHLYVRIN